jgi:hypothetical protein
LCLLLSSGFQPSGFKGLIENLHRIWNASQRGTFASSHDVLNINSFYSNVLDPIRKAKAA